MAAPNRRAQPSFKRRQADANRDEILESPDASLDATFVPKWESNIAMIWGLFGPAPAIVRMASETYRDSEWCQRESEMLEHLLERGDFMHRLVIDASERDVRGLTIC